MAVVGHGIWQQFVKLDVVDSIIGRRKLQEEGRFHVVMYFFCFEIGCKQSRGETVMYKEMYI